METADSGHLKTIFRLLSLSRPDLLPICGAFLFLVAAVIGEKSKSVSSFVYAMLDYNLTFFII